MKYAFVVVLILLILATGLPIMMSMDGMGWCPACLTSASAHLMGLCLGLLAAVLALPSLDASANSHSAVRPNYGRLHIQNLLRPPRRA